jgi:hypothetical protein
MTTEMCAAVDCTEPVSSGITWGAGTPDAHFFKLCRHHVLAYTEGRFTPTVTDDGRLRFSDG